MTAFEALAEPTRRAILEVIGREERSVKEIAERFPISQPGISKHLRVLREAGLVRVRIDAQRRLYSNDPGGLDEVERWVARYRSLWSQRLDALDTEIKRARRANRREAE